MSRVPLLATHRRQGERFNYRGLVRLLLPASVVTAFLVFVFTAGIIDETRHRAPSEQPDIEFPDFSQYKRLQTLPHHQFPIRPDDDKRVVAIGDIHAMNESLSALLDKISYDPRSDTLIHLGDLVSKNKQVSSEPLLSFMSTNHILGVRGNNDQKVIEWRAWMEWIATLPGGAEWLDDMDAAWSHVDGDGSNTEIKAWLKKSYQEWEPYVPRGWKLQGKHYKIARDMSHDHYDYLRSLPCVLYAPTAHTFFLHAGLLPADPTRPFDDPKQPLSHLPTTGNPEEDALVLRGLQEQALLDDVPQNQDPWVLMNMRSLSEDGQIESGKKGTPWSDLWNEVMEGCSGSYATPPPAIFSKHKLMTSCFPSMVLYGHAASRNLDIKRWSVGVDTGCAYGRRLTAVVLDAKSLVPQTRLGAPGIPLHESIIPYGDEGTAQVISIECHA